MAIGKSRIVSVSNDTEPVTLAEAKNYLRITNDTDDDALITSQISAARNIAETYLSRDILPRVREQFTTELDNRYLDLFFGPIDSITSVETEEDGTLTEDSEYEVVGLSTEPYIKFVNATSYKDITVTYETEGLTTDNTVKQGVLAILADLYNGEDIKKSCFAILSPLRKKYI